MNRAGDYGDAHSRLLVGHVLTRLADLPTASVQAVITSPPFYMARSYGTEPQIWGGAPDCQHAWGTVATPCGNGSGGGVLEPGAKDAKSAMVPDGARRVVHSDLCGACGAWRGEHGHEPTVQDWVRHEVLIYRELRRVLHPTGVMVIEGGDTYACAPNGAPEEIARLHDDRAFRNKPKAKVSLPEGNLHLQFERLMIALQDEGWRVRSGVVWARETVKPESLHGWREERCRKRDHEKRVWVPCPGCQYCNGTGGWRVRKGRWRPTLAHSMVWVLTGPGHYYADEYLMRDRDITETGHNAWTVRQFRRDYRNGKHTAGFPEALPAWCMQAFMPQEGICSECSAPKVRRVQEGAIDHDAQRRSGGDRNGQYHGVARGNHKQEGCQPPGEIKKNALASQRQWETLGWVPTCRCGAPFRPATVLDPFCGSGTTLRVARQKGHCGIGLELNASYAADAWNRIVSEEPEPEPKTKRAKVLGSAQRTLF